MDILLDTALPDNEIRSRIFEGAVYLRSSMPQLLELCDLARELIREAFAPLDPETVHEHLTPAQCASILAVLKPNFIHHPRSKKCLQAILTEFGCDPDQAYFDVPRLRTAFPGNFLSTGIAYAFHPHRDTWYSAPASQINWWLPVFEVTPGNCMAIHPHYFGRAIKNGSASYNYQRWNEQSRHQAAQYVGHDPRVQPHAEEELELEPAVTIVPPVGGAYLFSAAHLHSTVPNTTNRVRYSIDFRVVNLADLESGAGARNVDANCTGTTIQDYLRVRDLTHLPERVQELYRKITAA